MTLKFDEIGYWSEVKLDIIKLYASAYSKILSTRNNPKLYHLYIDAFAGPGKHISKKTGGFISGSPQIALDVKPSFREYYFIEISGEKVTELKGLVANNRLKAHVLQGDCNSILLAEVFPKVRWEDYRRGLCLLDPYGLDLKWEVIKTAGEMKSIDIFLNFPVMDINRNVLWSNPKGVDEADIQRMNDYWGDNSWRGIAYRQIPNLFGEIAEIKERNEIIVSAFRERLNKVAKFEYVPKPIPMRNSIGRTIYYLFFASHQKIAEQIINDIFDKYQNRGLP